MYTFICQNPSCNKEFQNRLKCSKYCSHRCANEVITKLPERRKKISLSNIGKVATLETRKKISDGNKGRKVSPETIQKSNATKAKNKKPRPLEVRQQISATLKRKIASGEIIPSQLGRKRPCTEERRKKQVISGQKWWDEHKGVKRNIDYDNRANSNRSRSKSEIAWGNFVESIFDVKLIPTFRIGRKSYDYRCGKFLFEIDGSYWHRNSGYNDQYKSDLADDNGFICYRFTIDTIKEALESIVENYYHLKFIFNQSKEDRYKEPSIRKKEISNG